VDRSGDSADAVLSEEERLWREIRDVVAAFPGDAASEPGYFAEGWSAKDALAHIGTWLAEAGVALERIRAGTYTRAPEGAELDAMNERFLTAMRDVRLRDVRAQAEASRARMRRAWVELAEPSAEALTWIAKAGPEHYAEHLPRLREWLDDVRAGTSA
jgi:Mycothiol maleylpyruvate isomerase N-terminal domain